MKRPLYQLISIALLYGLVVEPAMGGTALCPAPRPTSTPAATAFRDQAVPGEPLFQRKEILSPVRSSLEKSLVSYQVISRKNAYPIIVRFTMVFVAGLRALGVARRAVFEPAPVFIPKTLKEEIVFRDRYAARLLARRRYKVTDKKKKITKTLQIEFPSPERDAHEIANMLVAYEYDTYLKGKLSEAEHFKLQSRMRNKDVPSEGANQEYIQEIRQSLSINPWCLIARDVQTRKIEGFIKVSLIHAASLKDLPRTAELMDQAHAMDVEAGNAFDTAIDYWVCKNGDVMLNASWHLAKDLARFGIFIRKMAAYSNPRGLPLYAASKEAQELYKSLIESGMPEWHAAGEVELRYRADVIAGRKDDVAISYHFKKGTAMADVIRGAYEVFEWGRKIRSPLTDLMDAIGGTFVYVMEYFLDREPGKRPIKAPFAVHERVRQLMASVGLFILALQLGAYPRLELKEKILPLLIADQSPTISYPAELGLAMELADYAQDDAGAIWAIKKIEQENPELKGRAHHLLGLWQERFLPPDLQKNAQAKNPPRLEKVFSSDQIKISLATLFSFFLLISYGLKRLGRWLRPSRSFRFTAA